MPAEKHGFTPHITLAYVPKGEPVEIPLTSKEAISFYSIALAWGGRVSLFRLQGEQRVDDALATNKESSEMKDENKTPATEPAATATAVAPVEKIVEKEVPVIAVNQQQVDELLALSEAIKGAGGIGALVKSINDFAANQKSERDGLIVTLAANQALGMTAEDLGLLPTATLQRMQRVNAPTDYGLRNAAFASNTAEGDWEEYKAPTEESVKK